MKKGKRPHIRANRDLLGEASEKKNQIAKVYPTSLWKRRWRKNEKKKMLTFVESSNNFVCSAMKRTQKQLRCTSGGQCECENAGLFITGLLMPPEPFPQSGSCDNSSDSECGIGMGPWIWQLPPNGPVLLRLPAICVRNERSKENDTMQNRNHYKLTRTCVKNKWQR